MAVVATYHFGECTVHVHDDCIAPPEEQEKIKKRLAEIALNIYLKKMKREQRR